MQITLLTIIIRKGEKEIPNLLEFCKRWCVALSHVLLGWSSWTERAKGQITSSWGGMS